ncbi:serine/threonine-protein phosphatase 7 long form-like protein [Cucumis melo var. makuwa]|uniref:Serine/threonine-protein phosphatase 7 long form-like protein n=1 Tax=Cucumis melo var. makuwa TaxID=1194695 RepID=A0A5D3DED0_CUCMM|nr:serine/threonine-protein phosphatase 7 long form-like protein [Cucumis melo var. makuwa]
MGYLLHRRVELSEEREVASQHTIPFDQRIAPYLEAAGFLRVSQVGECTITLQDVAMQLRLPVDREPLIGSLRYNWKVICKDILGVVPSDMKGQRLSLLWLAEQFEELPSDVDVVSVQGYARAYIIQLIGGFLFAYKSNTLVHCMFLKFVFDFNQVGTYAWGATTLAWLYRKLYRSGALPASEQSANMLLIYRWTFDWLRQSQINWTLYTLCGIVSS